MNACLKKDPSERPTIENMLTEHAAFLNKARDMAYLKENFLATLQPLEQRLKP